MQKIKIHTEYIRLDQFLKWMGIADSGAFAKTMIEEGEVGVNGHTEKRRGKKLRPGDTVTVKGDTYFIK